MPKTLIQIGASGGQEVDEFVEMGITDALFIEPLDLPFSILNAKVSPIPNYFAFKALAHSVNGIEVEFHISSNGGMSSSVLQPAKHLNMYPEVSFPEKIKLTGFRLDSMIAHLNANKQIRFNAADLLFLDVQGAEIIVLQGAGEVLQNAKYVWTEVGTGDGYSGGASYMDVINFLAAYNFQLVYHECALGGFGDALFVKKDL